jgi:hypothetical protein
MEILELRNVTTDIKDASDGLNSRLGTRKKEDSRNGR